jgi:mannitol/fructose-specific phosphotransferase system IIA component (Ntr-type)
MRLRDLTAPGLVFPGLLGADPRSLLDLWSRQLVERGVVADAERLRDQLLEREALGSTGVGNGVAIPHCKLEALDDVVVSVGTTASPIEWGAVDGLPVRLLFLVASPAARPAAHLQTLAAISRWLKQDRHAERLVAATDPEAVWNLLGEEA